MGRVTGFDDDLATRPAAMADLSRLRIARARLRIVSGPDQGHEAELGATALVIGSGSGANLRLSDPLVSRSHLRITALSDGVKVEDLGSMNGTFASGLRLGSVVITADATLTIGDTTIALSFDKEKLDLPLSERSRFGEAIGHGAAMRHVFSLLEQAAKSDVTVLLEGESGAGKDVLARAVHDESARRDGPFVVVDCGAIPGTLLESELFGHERGAFTGATATRQGAFELADGGTLFLDEVGELSIDSQPKLLRAIESRAFRRVGGAQTVTVDVRIVAATNRRLREAVRAKEFRQDLFYRLAVVHVMVPRLAEHPEDIAPIAESFLRRVRPEARLPTDLAALLVGYDWPGNARELRNVVERFATFGRADEVLLFGQPDGDAAGSTSGDRFTGLDRLPYHEAKRRLMESFHAEILPRVVERAGGSVARAAELLELPRASLYRMLKDVDD
jgi:transcriptional regulator with GAF, ATPase, and Fis domain